MNHIQGGIFMDENQEFVEDVVSLNDENNTPGKKKINWAAEIKELLITFVICFVAVWTITTYVIKPVQVDGDSMYPTLVHEEVGAVNMLFVKMDGVERYDVVVVHNKAQDENWVKRVIGLPGETISAKDDIVYINGQPLEEPYLDTEYVKDIRSKGNYFTEDFQEITLGEDEYFLMGDNRVVSLDSRRVGPFQKEDIIGKDVYVVFPFDQMKMVRNPY